MDKFGFGCTTCCGFIPMPNDWEGNWIVSSTVDNEVDIATCIVRRTVTLGLLSIVGLLHQKAAATSIGYD